MVELESKVENDFHKIAWLEYKCLTFKFKRDGVKGGSDRLIFLPNGHSFFIEFKRPGRVGGVSEHQYDFEKLVANVNKKVYYCRTIQEAREALEYEIENYG